MIYFFKKSRVTVSLAYIYGKIVEHVNAPASVLGFNDLQEFGEQKHRTILGLLKWNANNLPFINLFSTITINFYAHVSKWKKIIMDLEDRLIHKNYAY